MGAANLDIQWVQPTTAVVALRGDFTLDTAPSLGRKLVKLSKKDKVMLILNLAELSAIDTAGIATLVEVLRTLNSRHGKLRLSGLSERFRRVMQLARLDRIFAVYDTVDAALAPEGQVVEAAD
jgi:anti-sigma B factor antagonist